MKSPAPLNLVPYDYFKTFPSDRLLSYDLIFQVLLLRSPGLGTEGQHVGDDRGSSGCCAVPLGGWGPARAGGRARDQG